jgi:hypothetical protein
MNSPETIEGYRCTLRCFACGQTKPIIAPEPPRFAFEVAKWAQDIGWIGALDPAHSRSLVFCSQACCDASKTKNGQFRLRPKNHENPKTEVPA